MEPRHGLHKSERHGSRETTLIYRYDRWFVVTEDEATRGVLDQREFREFQAALNDFERQRHTWLAEPIKCVMGKSKDAPMSAIYRRRSDCQLVVLTHRAGEPPIIVEAASLDRAEAVLGKHLILYHG